MQTELAERLLAHWFGSALQSALAARARVKLWFRCSPAFDRTLARHFHGLPERARDGDFDAWTKSPRTSLARILALDQLPRNLYRGSAQAYAFDAAALAAALDGTAQRHDQVLHPLEAVFFYLPFEHAENPDVQRRAVALFEQLQRRAPPESEKLFAGFADYARRHRDVIARFGRFPHRNAVLARVSTPEEVAYLANGGERFGSRSRPTSTRRQGRVSA